MTLLSVLGRTVAVTGVLLGASLLAIVGPSRLRAVRDGLGRRVRWGGPYVVVLGVVLAANSVLRDVGLELSYVVGVHLTGTIHAVEGEFVAWVQSFAVPPLTTLFSLSYVYGYVYLLVFPLVAYAVLDDLDPFRTLTLAYVLNYAIGLACYIVFVAYGPRNLMPELVESLLYVTWPDSQLLSSEINTNTNVFPSLHASLSTTVAIVAVRTRSIYPRWTPVAVALAATISASTVYLGIHWGTDVVAGLVLAVVSVSGADRLSDRIRARRSDRETVRPSTAD